MSYPPAILTTPTNKGKQMLKVQSVNESQKQICTLEIVIDGTPYYYEAHTPQRVAEILHSQIETLNSLNEKYNSQKTIDTFTVHYFA